MPGLAARFWADVSFVVGNSGTSLTPGLRTASKTRSPRSTVSRRASYGCLHSQNIVKGRGRSPPKRSLATHVATARSWEDEAFQDALSQSHRLPPSTEHGVSVYDESLKAASPLRSPPPEPLSPRFDWRLRATSRAVTRSGGLQSSHDGANSRAYVKRVIPQHLEIQSGEPFHHEVNAYENRFLPLLELEQAEEEKEMRERLAKWPLKRLRDEGYCITGMSAFWLDSKYGHVASFALGPGVALPDNKFEGGTSVLVTRVDPLQEKPLHGRVLSRTSTQLRISFHKLFAIDGQQWRLDLGQSNVVYERMCHAIAQLHHDPHTLQEDNSNPESELVLLGTHLRDVILRSFSPSGDTHEPKHFQAADDTSYAAHDALDHSWKIGGGHGGIFKDDMRIQSWAKRYSRVNPIRVDGDPELHGLNATQVRAVAMMVGERFSLIHGPPGTGKSKTIIEAARLLKAEFEVPLPILICTYTNMALDHVVEGLVGRGLKPLRVGIDGKVQPALREYSLEAYLDRHPRRSELERLVRDETNLQEKMRTLERNIDEARTNDKLNRQANLRAILANVDRQFWGVRAKLYRLRQVMITDVLKQADVSQHVVLIGDHKQLPPVIRSREAQIRGLNIGLFERLTEEGAIQSIMLDMQYRMHPEISRFPSSEFYARSLKDGTVDSGGNILTRLRPPLSEHLVINTLTGDRPSVVFLDHDGLEAMKDRSRINVTDAAIVCAVIEDLLRQNDDLRGEDIGVISPYIAQISLLNYLLNVDPDRREHFRGMLGATRAEELAQIEVKTVNGFEGRQKEIVLFSTVRNNAAGSLGFLADRRRLNVGLTRARRGLFVIGGLATLRAGSAVRGAAAWKHYADFLAGAQLVRPLKGDALREVLGRSGWGIGESA
ncbi:P-loop containing nucleoside triphosphate hydrolase protein [Lactarius hatsudake]|nr:P-loop containing nucleoside triphosphate hydrolase protein [Lactarius hatsudake]